MKKTKNRRSWLPVLLVLGLLAAFVIPNIITARSMANETAGPEAKVERLVLDQLAAESETDFFVWMTEKADLSPAAALKTKEEKGQFVFDTLRATAESTQKELRDYLDAQGITYRPFYIANKIYVESGNLEAVMSIAAREDVAQITANHAFQLQEPFIDPNPLESIEGIEPNLTFVNADDVWALGYDGSGTVMAGNDTGLDWDHPALKEQYRGWDGSTADHNYNWWDATGTYPTIPDDGHGHGTHTTGTMVGDDGGSNQIGVAPGAQTIHCKNMTNGGSGDDFTFSTCFEWDLAPWDLSGNNPMPSLAPDAINNSWGYFGGNAPQFEDEILALRAAGIVVEVSAGNEGSGCATLRSPGDYHQSLTTGSVNHFGTFPGTITGFSSRGPSDLYPGEFMPDIMAPGESINSSLPGGGYSGPTWSGTSMAGPHVTALVALMWDASPGIAGDVALTEQIIIDTAVPLTGQNGSNCGGDYTNGPNNDWGFGTMDALAAVQEAIVQGGPFGLEADPASLAICTPDDAAFNIDVLLNEPSFSDPVDLDALGEPGGTTVNFSADNQAPPFSSVLTIGNTGSASAGSYDIDVVGVSGSEVATATVELNVYDDTPGTVNLVAPADGATDVGLVPTFEWSAATQGDTYLLEVADDAGFSNIVYSESVPGTSHEASSALDEDTTYYWRVTPENVCGAGSPSDAYSFTTTTVPDVLLVDDDDNSPNVQATYTSALDNLGVEYDIWNTNNTDNEPTAAQLAPYRTVIWFTGDEFGGAAGPGGTGEAALASWLDTGRCLFISSQDYYYDRGKTPFMDNYLGVNTATSDVSQTTVTGAGSVYAGLGPYSLTYPFSNYSDVINPDGAPAELAFSGTAGNAAVNKDSGTYRTTFWGFPWEAIGTPAGREEALQTTLDWCAALPAYDVDLSGNQSDEGQPGDTVEYLVTVTNDGNVADTFDLTVSGETWTTTLSTSSVTLDPGDSDTFTVSVEIPGGAAPGDSDTATVTATSTGNSGVTDSMNVTTSVPEGQQTYGVNVSGNTNGGGAAGDVVSYNVTVTNTGDGSDTFDLVVSGYTWATTLSDNSVTLAAGESTVVTVEVTIPGDAAEGDSDTVTVTATSAGDASVSDSLDITTTVGGPNYQTFLPLMMKQP